MARLAHIDVYPIKSFDPLRLEKVVLLASGALENDRRFALADRDGNFMNAKRSPAVHLLRSAFDPVTNRLTLRVEDSAEEHAFDVVDDRGALCDFVSDYFATPLDLVENVAAGFPDDTDSPGPTLISTATLTEVASWFPGVTVDEARRRFRANLEIDGVEPFWEDRLVAAGTSVVRFQIGAAELWGTNPCQRCPVPTRNPFTGEALREFAKLFARHRQQSLPAWAPADRFNHFYRLATNTRRAPGERIELKVGDSVSILGIA